MVGRSADEIVTRSASVCLRDVMKDFAARARPWWPAIDASRLAPAYSGVRPHIGTDADFRIDGPQTHGLPGLVNLFGIGSPGLTSSLAIGDHVKALLDG